MGGRILGGGWAGSNTGGGGGGGGVQGLCPPLFLLSSKNARPLGRGAVSPQVKSSVQFESRRSGLQREEARDSWAGVVLPDPQLRLLCLDTGRLPARELEREEQELAGLTTF